MSPLLLPELPRLFEDVEEEKPSQLQLPLSLPVVGVAVKLWKPSLLELPPLEDPLKNLSWARRVLLHRNHLPPPDDEEEERSLSRSQWERFLASAQHPKQPRQPPPKPKRS